MPRARTRSYRKVVLKRLMDFRDHEAGPDAYLSLDPIDILKNPLKKPADRTYYQSAITQLTSEGLILGIDAEGRPVFRINPDSIPDVQKELTQKPTPMLKFVVTLLGALAALAAVIWAIIRFLISRHP